MSASIARSGLALAPMLTAGIVFQGVDSRGREFSTGVPVITLELTAR